MSGISKRVNGSWESGDYGIMKTATDTITTLPAVLYPNDTTATVGLKGNMVQNGTPTPSNPIQPSECGDRTGNLFDGQLQQGYYAYLTGEYTLADTYVCTHLIPCTENTTYTFRCINMGGGSKNYGYVFLDSAQNRIDSDYINEQTEGDVVTHTATTPQNTAFLAINIAYGRRQASVVRPSDITDFMLNEGSTPLPYEPYGYKIPILSNSTTTPVYLGEVQSTRQINKLVLTGEENWQIEGGKNGLYSAFLDDITNNPQLSNYLYQLSSHFQLANDYNTLYYNSGYFSIVNMRLVLGYFSLLTVNDFKEYLRNQYANGTPVTVWYVLATPTTGIVNEPIRKISDYADTVSGISIPTIAGENSFDVLTTLKPSEATVNYKGWHPVADVHERENGAWT